VQGTAEARLLNTEDAAIGQNVESKRVVELPIAYPSIGQLALIVPGVSFGTRLAATTRGRGALFREGFERILVLAAIAATMKTFSIASASRAWTV
jgi:hypothetical protein